MSYSCSDFADDVTNELIRLGVLDPNAVPEGDDTASQCADLALAAINKLHQQRDGLLQTLERILRAHDSGNNGAVMGEAVLCHAFAELARAEIRKAKEG